MNQRLYDKGPWLTLDKALEKIEKLLMDAEGEKKEILESLEKNLNAKGG
jgi:CRISPR/Cas system-associated protein Csx1